MSDFLIDENDDYNNNENNNDNENGGEDDESRSEPAARQTFQSDFNRTRKEEDQIKAREAELLFKAK